MTKVCSVCGKEKPMEEFDKTSIGTYTSRCKSCRKDYDRRRRADPIIKARIAKQKHDWLQHPSVKERAKKKSRLWKSTLEGALRTLMYSVMRRDPDTDLTLETLIDMWKTQKGRCVQTNVEMSLVSGDKDVNNLWKVSIDRIDRRIRYMVGNVQLVCCGYNYAKNNNTDELTGDFIRDVSYQYVSDHANISVVAIDANNL